MGSETMINRSKGPSKFNTLWWVLIIVLLVGGIVASVYYQTLPWPLQLVGWIVLAVVVLGLAALTTQGQQFWVFSKEARAELRKVVWPTRQETIQTTTIVIGMVVLTSLILWGVDSVLMLGISWLTGQH